MAITFTEEISEINLINAFNNNIVKFSSDNVSPSISCYIIIAGSTYEITPDNNNVFRYNFGGRESAFVTEVNQDNFSDNVVFNVNPLDVSTLTLSDNSSFSLLPTTFTINFEDGSDESIIKNYKVLKSVMQFNDTEVLSTNDDINWLSNNNITYFKGYPFDISFYMSTNDVVELHTSYLLIDRVEVVDFVNRIIISDGINGIEDFAELSNYDSLTFPDFTPTKTLKIKVIDECGEYLKFMNKYGSWNYWLFNNKSQHILETKNLKQIYNNFENVGENISPVLEIGKTGKTIINLHSSNITDNEMSYLKDLFVSPKVYYFTGNKNEKMHANSFIEVKFKGQKTKVKNYKTTTYNINATIELPPLNTMTL